jgi:hypothetical protein
MKKPALIIGTLTILVIMLSVAKIYVSNQIATSGVVLGKVEEEVSVYRTENILLSEKLYFASALTNIEKEAVKLGFVEQKSDFVLNGQVPVAFKQ